MRNRSWFWLQIAAVAALALASGCAANPQATGGSKPFASDSTASARLTVAPLDLTGSAGHFRKLDSVADTAALPTELTVYKVVPANVKKPRFKSSASRLGLRAEVREDDRSFVTRGEHATFTIDKETGSFDYTTDDLEPQTKPIARALTDQQYRDAAEKFLRDAGLMEPEAEFRDVNRGNVVGTYENGAWVERPYMIEVRFSHKPLEGIPFDKGVGPRIVVQFGEDGRVLGAMSVWRKVEPYGRYKLKSAQQALTEIKAGNGQLFDVEQDAEGTVDDISISYLNEPLGYDQRFVLPAFLMKGQKSNGKPFAALSRAIPDTMLTVDPTLSRGTKAPQSTEKK